MRRTIKTLIISAVVSALFTIPVMAQEITDPKAVYTEDKFCIDEQKLIDDFHRGEVWRCENYVSYLDGVIFNLNETARIKKEVVTNYTYLSQFNPAFRDKIPQAQKEYDEAVAWVNAYKEYRKAVQADLKVRYKY